MCNEGASMRADGVRENGIGVEKLTYRYTNLPEFGEKNGCNMCL
jgi:hypothetical protein